MIRVLGFKRIMILLVLVGLNLAFAALLYGYLFPEKLKAQQDLRRVQNQISGVQTDISRLQVEYDQLEMQQTRFDGLEKDGFFNDQSRREAEDILQRIQKSSGVISAVASIKPGVFEENPEAAKADHKLLNSEVSLKIEALDDTEIFAYFYLLEKYFPGHISIEKIEMQRKSALNAAVLRSVATGANPPLVTADIKLAWRTMIPASKVLNAQEN